MKILVIDDEYVALSRMVKLFSRWGESVGATNAAQAMELAKDGLDSGEPFDIISIDIELPDSDGLDLLNQFQELEEQSHLSWVSKKIIVSAQSKHDNITKALALGCDDFLVKPVSVSTLEEKMKLLLSSDS